MVRGSALCIVREEGERWREARKRVGGRWLYRSSENRCSNAPPRDYVRAGALSRRVIMRGAIICNDDDEKRV